MAMSMDSKKDEKTDRRARALRDNLLRRREKKHLQTTSQDENTGKRDESSVPDAGYTIRTGE